MTRHRARSWSDQDLITAVANHYTYADVLRSIGLKVFAGNYTYIKSHIARLNLDLSHWSEHKRGGQRSEIVRNSNKEIFCETIRDQRATVRRRVLRDRLLDYECAACRLSEWQGKPLSLHLDHINGNSSDHRLHNLRFLCPNCHSQTPTYGGRNIPINPYILTVDAKIIPERNRRCLDCGKDVWIHAKRCRGCAQKQRHLDHPQPTKITWPSQEELLDLLQRESYVSLGRKLGVTDNAIRKRLRNHKI